MNTVDAFIKWCEQRNEYVEYCGTYGEPGYTDPEKGILFANWNDIPKRWADRLEREGCELEWSDEWYVDYNYGKAYRTSPDSYGWQSSIMYTEDGDILTPDDDVAEWIAACELFDPSHATLSVQALPSWIRADDILALGDGWELIATGYENGFYPGQTDDPAAIARAMFEDGYNRVLFQLSSVGQFDVHFKVWGDNGE